MFKLIMIITLSFGFVAFSFVIRFCKKYIYIYKYIHFRNHLSPGDFVDLL